MDRRYLLAIRQNYEVEPAESLVKRAMEDPASMTIEQIMTAVEDMTEDEIYQVLNAESIRGSKARASLISKLEAKIDSIQETPEEDDQEEEPFDLEIDEEEANLQ